MVVGTLGAGGYFVPTEKIGFFDALYAKTVLAQLGVNLLTGLSANSDLPGFSVPVSTSWNGETDTISPADATVVNGDLRPHALAGATDISRQLMVQTNDSIDAYILGSIMKSMKVSLENAVINGDGTNKPLGILSTPNIQTVAIGTNGGNLTPALVQKLITAVLQANADEGSCKFLTNFKVRSFLKQLTIDSGSGAMVMSYMKYFQGEANMIDSFETICTSNVPSNLTKGSGTNLSALIFGDFSQVVIGQFGGVSLSIDNVSAAVVRAQKVALTVTQFVDSAVKQPTAIGAILDATA
jgi:HK97 family phage major capsid protein